MSMDPANLQGTAPLLQRAGIAAFWLAAALVLGAATAAWFAYGTQIFITLADNALGWCF